MAGKSYFKGNLSEEEFADVCLKHLETEIHMQNRDTDWARDIISLFRDRLSFTEEILDHYEELFPDVFEVSEENIKFIKDNGGEKVVKSFSNAVERNNTLYDEDISKIIKEVQADTNTKGKVLYILFYSSCLWRSSDWKLH